MSSPPTVSDALDVPVDADGAPRGIADLRIDWHGDHTLNTSLSLINRAVVGRLRAGHGASIRRVATGGASALDAAHAEPVDVEVRHHWPPDLRAPAAGRLAVIQPWEFGSIPAAWVRPLQDRVDELWVYSEYVRGMYLDAGVDPARVHVIPVGVDLERFSPDGPSLPLDAPGLRLLFVGGALPRKGIDVLLSAYMSAFAGRDDVTLVIKDFGVDGVYRGQDRSAIAAAVAAGTPRVMHLTDDLSDDDMAALYRACDVLVHPYRGEGFAMPVLEAMACGLPVIHTDGGPTAEFCPPEAGWRIRSSVRRFPDRRVGDLETVAEPWMLEPDAAHLVTLLHEAAAASADARRALGSAGRAAAERLSWDAVIEMYANRLEALAARPPLTLHRAAAALVTIEGPAPRLLATPAWGGGDALADLLRAWATAAPAGTAATLVLPADPELDGDGAALEAHVLAAAARAGVDLDRCADIELTLSPAAPGRDEALHRACDAYVSLHEGCAGHRRLALAAARPVLAPHAAALAAWLAGAGADAAEPVAAPGPAPAPPPARDTARRARFLQVVAQASATTLADNVDHLFSPYGEPLPDPAGAGARLARELDVLDACDAVWDDAGDEATRDLLLHFLAYRALGPAHVRLQLDPLDYRRAVVGLTAAALRRPGVLGAPGLPFEWQHHEYDLSAVGGQVRVVGPPLPLASTFLFSQYAYRDRAVAGAPRPGDVVLDVGGCWGDTALWFAQAVGPQGRVHTVEPSPANRTLLRQNLDRNAALAGRVRVWDAPLAAVAGATVRMQDCIAAGASLVDGAAAANARTVDLRTSTVDDLVAAAGVDRVDVIKVDVEGADVGVLEGATATIARHRPLLALACYHADDDLVTLPAAVAPAGVRYRWYLQCSTMTNVDTVLFGVPDGR
jgi:FkbM family methyltransferase